MHTSPVYLDQRRQNQQQHSADRDLQNSYRRNDCAQTCSSCSSPFLSLSAPALFLPHPALTEPCLPALQPPAVFLKSGTVKSKFPWQDQQQQMGGRRCTGIGSSCCPARGVPAPLTPLASQPPLIFSPAVTPPCHDLWNEATPWCIPHQGAPLAEHTAGSLSSLHWGLLSFWGSGRSRKLIRTILKF